MAKNYTNNQLLIKEIVNQEFQDSGSFKDISSFFEFFSASQALKEKNLSNDEIINGIVGGGNDGGCDSVFLFLNNELITADQVDGISCPKNSVINFTVIQSKYTSGFGEDAIMKWKSTVSNLLDMNKTPDDYKERYDENVIDAFQIFKDVLTKVIRYQIKIEFNFIYITFGIEVHINVQSQANEFKETLNALYPSSNVNVLFITADKLMEYYNCDTEVNQIITFDEAPIAKGKNSEFISLVRLSEYYKFIIDDANELRNSFFESNVRDYQGNNQVNSCIAESLISNEKEDFWWLNNGVTVLAEKVVPITQKELQITNPEIVNGLQTSTEIFNYFHSNIENLQDDSRSVLVRIIVPESEELRDKIIFATNNQTNIPKSSLRVTDTIHYQIELYFKNRGLFYDRRKNYYKNRKKKACDIIGVNFLAQCMITLFLKKPDFARARPSTLLTDDEKYSYLYEKNNDLEVFYKTARIGKRVQIYLSKKQGLSSAEKNDILYYLLYYVVAKTIANTEIDFSDIKSLDIDSISDFYLDEAIETVVKKYKELGGNGRVAKSSNFINEIEQLL